MPRFLALAAGMLALLPASASGGAKVTAGDQSLRFTASASARALKLHYAYSSLNPDGSVRENPRRTTFTLPADMKLHPSRRPQCRVSDLNAAAAESDRRYVGEVCPKASLVGTGMLTIDGRHAPCDGCVVPLCPVPPTEFRVGVEVVNTLDDVRPDGTMRRGGFPAVTLYGYPQYGRPFVQTFDISHPVLLLRTERLEYCSWTHVHGFDVTIRRGPARNAYLTVPHRCGPNRTWRFEMAIVNYDGPTIAAHDRAACRR